MLPRQFAKLPVKLQNEMVRPYYELLSEKRRQLFFRRGAECLASALLLLLLSPLLLLLATIVRLDSPGPALYRQVRVTMLGRQFTIYKFRTMRGNATTDAPLTGQGDFRITRSGRWMRRYRLDELPQLYNILKGEMSFVGPRPELPRFVERYDPTSLATLLLPAGLTGEASLIFADEGQFLDTSESERVYADLILPRKNAINLIYIAEFSLKNDLKILAKTVACLFGTKDFWQDIRKGMRNFEFPKGNS